MRPSFHSIDSGEEFLRWYWLKEELIALCKEVGLPATGGKFELRDRIAYALDHDGAVLSKPQKKPTSTFSWAKEKLTRETLITDNISFGPNVRNFLKSQIGPRCSCHSDFMEWVLESPGKTLGDAIDAWWQLESRKDDPKFRRQIKSHNMYNQYTRDFMDDNPGRKLTDARACWEKKKRLPAPSGFVRYERGDLDL